MSSPFLHYNSAFDPVSLLRKYTSSSVRPSEGYITNFLGVKIHPDYVPDSVKSLAGQLEPTPIPANWHADLSEFAAVLRSVELAAGPRFVVGELGCGWGCWLAIAGLAAKSRGLDVLGIGIESDQKHIEWANNSMQTNGFSPDEFRILRGAAASRSGKAWFPRNTQNELHYGLQPIFSSPSTLLAEPNHSDAFEAIEMLCLSDVFKNETIIHLLHIDIQGSEVELLEGSLDFISNKVAYVVVGTHSRVIEGQMISLMSGHDWTLEIERPAIFDIGPRSLTTTVDGVQGWRNLRMLPTNLS